MRPPRADAAFAGVAVLVLALALARPAIGQQAPESLLPPGLGAQPAPSAAPPPAGAPPSADASIPAIAAGSEDAADAVDELPLDNAADEAPPPPEELPAAARRSLAAVGAAGGYGEAAFGDADGRYLATLMRRLQTPIASRWTEIALRRMLLGATPPPAGEAPADWVADRASLLLRLGEADGARTLVQAVDVENYTPRLRAVAIRTALATSDPAALCPLPAGTEMVGDQPAWPMIRAICAALSGDTASANAAIGRGAAGDFVDHPLAEKLVAAAGAGRRAVTIDWGGVDQLTDWRFGLATALNLVLPQALVDAAPVWMQGWLARAPMLSAADRIAPARTAAALGPVSAADLVDLYGRVMDEAGTADTDSPAGRLRAAYRADDEAGRLKAMRTLWDAAVIPEASSGDVLRNARERYAAQILTARAAAGLTPSREVGDEIAPIMGALFAAGLDVQAERWAPVVRDGGGEAGQRAWSILAVGASRPVVPSDAARVRAFVRAAGADGRSRAAMLVAALAALGRLPRGDAAALAQEIGVPLGGQPAFARALDRAVGGSEGGTVVLLTAVAMQDASWRSVPPGDFYRALAALRTVGLDAEARMIAAEAMTRL